VVPVNNAGDVAKYHAIPAILFLLASIVGPAAAFPADIVVPPTEAPTTIFATKLGSMDVDLTLLGSWTASASFGTGILLAPGLPAQALDAFPSLDQGFIFSQTPDITISLDLFKRFFLSATVVGSFANNSIQLGYRGQPGEVIQSVVLGTQGITMAPSQLLQIPAQPLGSLGAAARFVSGNSTNDLLVRWDAPTRKLKTFVGMNELVEQEVELNSYVKGRYFFLPDTGLDAGTLQVFLEDQNGTFVSPPSPAGDGRRYRPATFSEVRQDSVRGLIYFPNAVKGRVLVYYAKGGTSVGNAVTGSYLPDDTGNIRHPGTQKAFNWSMTYFGVSMSTTREVVLSGVGNALLLWQPGDNSPFEIDSTYAFQSDPPADTSKITYRFNAKIATASLPSTLIFQSDPINKRFLVLANTNLADRANFTNFYPFPDTSGLLYGPQRDSITGSLNYNIFYQFLNPVSSYILEANIIPGSVQVLLNNIPETRFQVEPVSGTLTMQIAVNPTDRLDVTYSVVSSDTTGGDLLVAWRDTIHFSDAANLFFDAAIRWNFNPLSFSQLPYSKSGTVIATAGISGKTDTTSYSAEAGVSYTNPDTTGILRLFGMEGDITAIDLSDDNAFPASAPADSAPFGAFAPTQFNRGQLYYQDFRSYGALGATTLEPINWTDVPAHLPYAPGSRMGPFNVAGSADSGGVASLNATNLVFDYSMSGSGPATQWVGAQLPISAGSDVDLSGARAITLRYRAVSAVTSSIYLQVGSVSEDLDGQAGGVPKAEPSSTSAGFSFVDQSNGVALLVGAGPQLKGNGRLDSEDRNSNVLLDLDDPNRIVTRAVTVPVTAWSTLTFYLSDAERQRLLQTHGMRIIITDSAGSSGEIIIDSITIEGTPFAPETADRSQVQVQEVPEALASDSRVAPSDFASAFPTTYKLFHPNAEPNHVLETKWAAPTGGPFKVNGFVPTASGPVENQGTGGIQYQTIVTYLRSTAANVTYQFSLMDSSLRGIAWTITAAQMPAGGAWHEVKVSSKDNTVRIDGNSVGAPTQFDSGYGSLTKLTVTVSDGSGNAPAAPGLLYIDEVYCTDPEGAFGAAFVGTFDGKFPGTLVKLGKVPVVSNLAVHQDLSLATAGFSPLYGTPSPTEDLASRTHADADVLFTHTSVDVEMREAGGVFSAAGGHKIVIPSLGIPVSLSDAFTLNWSGGFSREDTLGFIPGSYLSLLLDTTANADTTETADSGLLTQAWQANLSVNPSSTISLVSALSLSQALSGYPIVHDWYGARWVNESVLVIPWAGGGEVLRTEKLDFRAAMAARPVGFSIEAEADASKQPDVTFTGFSQQNNFNLSAGAQVLFGEGSVSDISMSLTYTRQLSLTTTPTAATTPGPWGGFADQANDLLSLLSRQGYLLTAIPFVEFFSDNTPIVSSSWQSSSSTLNAIQGDYSPSLTLSLQRSFGSHLVDLFVPSSVDLSFGQDLKNAVDLTQANIYIRPKISTRAVNLFGQLGAYPFFPDVRTDEYSLSVSGSVDGGTGLPTILSTLSAEAYASLTGNNENELTLVQILKRDQVTLPLPVTNITGDTQLLLDWVVRPEKGIVLPLLPADFGKNGRFAHRESAELTVNYTDNGTYHPLTLVLGHATTLVFEGHGTIKGSLNLGMDAENLGTAGIAWRFAVRAALEAKLTF
jgi:hypothetical protein